MIFQSFPARAQRYAARARPGQTRPGARAIQHYTRQHFLGFDSSLLALTLLISPVRALRCIRHPITEKWVNGTRRWFPLQQQRSVQSVERMNEQKSFRSTAFWLLFLLSSVRRASHQSRLVAAEFLFRKGHRLLRSTTHTVIQSIRSRWDWGF